LNSLPEAGLSTCNIACFHAAGALEEKRFGFRAFLVYHDRDDASGLMAIQRTGMHCSVPYSRILTAQS
jgi:hypothetical protein